MSAATASVGVASAAVAAPRRSWWWIARLGLAQVAIGAVAALMTSTLNRVMVVELAFAAAVPSVLVALHFVVQTSRAQFGFAADRAPRRAPWIVGGTVIFALGGVIAAAGTALAATHRTLGLAVNVLAYVLLGIGLSAGGTAVLAHVAEEVEPRRLGAAAALLWIQMIFGIAVTAGVAGQLLDPFSFTRLVQVTAGVCVAAVVLATLGTLGSWDAPRPSLAPERRGMGFAEALREAGRDPATRRFALFVFFAMLAYSAQDLILEPFAGRVFGLTPGESTKLGGVQHGGVMLGMLGAAILSTRFGSLRAWAAAGCLASAGSLAALAQAPTLAATLGLAGPMLVSGVVFTLGVSNGVFAVGAIGSMMATTATEKSRGAGLRLGVYGAAQALAYGAGSLSGGIASDLTIAWYGDAARGYAAVFMAEAVLFVVAAAMAVSASPATRHTALPEADAGETILGAMR